MPRGPRDRPFSEEEGDGTEARTGHADDRPHARALRTDSPEAGAGLDRLGGAAPSAQAGAGVDRFGEDAPLARGRAGVGHAGDDTPPARGVAGADRFREARGVAGVDRFREDPPPAHAGAGGYRFGEDVPPAPAGEDTLTRGTAAQPATLPEGQATSGRRARQNAAAARARAGKAAKRKASAHHGKRANDEALALSPAKAKAVAGIFSGGRVASSRSRADATAVPRAWLQRTAYLAADTILAEDSRALRSLLTDVQRAAKEGALIPGNFVWCRMYDESPFTMRTHLVDPVSGEMEAESSKAKVLGCRCRFAFTVFVPRGEARRPGAGRDRSEPGGRRAGVDSPSGEDVHIVVGHMVSRLSTVTSLHASKVAEALRQTMSLGDDERAIVEATFPRCAVLRNADLHKSNDAAERQQMQEKPRWPSARWRCSFHRLGTAEGRTLAMDAPAESALFNMGLVMRVIPGARKSFTARVIKWVSRVVVYHGEPPEDVVTWRAWARPLLFPAAVEPPGGQSVLSLGEERRRFCFEHVLNGDGRRSDEVQHWCSGCCTCREDTLRLVLGATGIRAIVDGLDAFPRRSWLGQRASAGRWLHAELTHGCLSQNFSSVKGQATIAVTRARARLAQAGQDTGTCGDMEAAAIAQQRMQEDMQERTGDVIAFLARPDHVPRLVQVCRVLDCFVPVKIALLSRAGEDWQRDRAAAAWRQGQVVTAPRRASDRSIEAESQEALQMPFPGAGGMAMAYEGQERQTALALATDGFSDDTGVGATSAWRQWSRLGGLLHEITCAEIEDTTQWKLSALPHRPDLAEDLSCTAYDVMDPVTCQHVLAYPTHTDLLSARSLAEATAMAEVLEETTLHIERNWSYVRQGLGARGSTAPPEHIHKTSAEKVPRELRIRHRPWECLRGHPTESQGGSEEADRPGADRSPLRQPRRARRGPGGRRRRFPAKKHRVSRPGGPCRAWFSANHPGGKFSQSAMDAYRAAMSDPAQRRKYTEIGRLMRAAHRVGAGGRRREPRVETHMDKALRRARASHHRADLPWDAAARAAARHRIEEDAKAPLAIAWGRVAKAATDRRALQRKRRISETQMLVSKARAATADIDALFPTHASSFCALWPAVTLPGPAGPSLAPASHAPGASSGCRARLWSWAPPISERAQQLLLSRQCGPVIATGARWAGQHATITAGPRVPAPTQAQSRAAANQAAGTVVFPPPGQTPPRLPTTGALAMALASSTLNFAGLLPRRRGVKVASIPRAVQMRDGHVILRCVLAAGTSHPAEEFWFHVAHCYFNQQMRPTLLRLRLVAGGDGESDAVLQPAHAIAQHVYDWRTLVQAASRMATQAPRATSLRVECWNIRECRPGMALPRRQVCASWTSSADRAWYSGADLEAMARQVAEAEAELQEEGGEGDNGAGGDRPPCPPTPPESGGDPPFPLQPIPLHPRFL